MSDYLIPVAVAVLAWWLSTVVILYRAGLPRTSFRRTLIVATAVALIGVWLLYITHDDQSPTSAYLAFFGALAVFGWHEVSYLFGFVSGPKPQACPDNCSGWARFVRGVNTCIYHELAVVASVLALALGTFGSANQVGLWTLTILWLMRWSAKMNIFLGVPNLHVEFWPEHLAYLSSFIRERSMNALFPWSIIVATTFITLLVIAAADAAPGSADQVGASLLATLLALATLEHWLLILRLPDELLWQPGLRSRRASAAQIAPADAGTGP